MNLYASLKKLQDLFNNLYYKYLLEFNLHAP